MTTEIVLVLMWMSAKVQLTNFVSETRHYELVDTSTRAVISHYEALKEEQKKTAILEVRGVASYNQGIEESICKTFGHKFEQIPCGNQPYNFSNSIISVWPDEKCSTNTWRCAYCKLKKRIVTRETKEEVFER